MGRWWSDEKLAYKQGHTRAKPSFKFGEVKKAISPHCYNRSLLRSFSYLTFDLVLVTLLLYSTIYYFALPGILGIRVLWHGYWVAQGSVLTGVWVIAHECGHHAFNDSFWVNDTVGTWAYSPFVLSWALFLKEIQSSKTHLVYS